MGRASLRDQLLDGAARVLLERGYNAASVNDIVAEAHVPKGSFYNHFRSKEDLGIEVLRRYIDELALNELSTSSKPPLEALREHVDRVIEQRARAGLAYGCLLGNLSTDVSAISEPLRAEVDRGFELWTGAIAEVIARAQRAGEITNDMAADALARYVVASLEGAVARAKVTLTSEPISDFLAITFDAVLR